MKKVLDEIDLHGLAVDEAIPLVDRFLHESFKAGLYRVWIIHGRGTGVLRSEVTHYLTNHSGETLFDRRRKPWWDWRSASGACGLRRLVIDLVLDTASLPFWNSRFIADVPDNL